MMLLHFLQRILKTLPWTLSSEIEYLAWHASHTIFMGIPAAGYASDPQAHRSLEKSYHGTPERTEFLVTFRPRWGITPQTDLGGGSSRPDPDRRRPGRTARRPSARSSRRTRALAPAGPRSGARPTAT